MPPPPRLVTVLRPSFYVVQVSSNGRRWRTVAVVRHRRGPVDTIRLRRVKARFVRIGVTAASQKTLPMLDELTVTG